MLNVIEFIRASNTGRDPERLAMKYANLRRDPFTFLRGTCALYYRRLPRESLFRSVPLAWICGDLHVENFGSYKGDNRLVYFDLNDFDEAVLAPCTLDLVRFVTSLMVAAHVQKVPVRLGEQLGRVFLDAYAAALADGKARWIERETAQGCVRELLDALQTRSRAALLDVYTEKHGHDRRLRGDGYKTLPVTAAQRKKVAAFMKAFAAGRHDPDFFRMLDVARRIAGTGSLGVERYVILVEGKGGADGHYLLDLKQARTSCLLPRLRIHQPAWKTEARRVVAIQQRAQAIPMAFLNSVILGGRSFVLRALQPSQDRIRLDFRRDAETGLEDYAKSMGELVAWSHLRTSGRNGSATADDFIAFGKKRKWRQKLLAQAKTGCTQTIKDWKAYAKAYDEGLFDVPE